MPYAAPFLKVSAVGHFGVDATTFTEEWSAGFHVMNPITIGMDPTLITGFLVAISSAVSTYHTATATNSGANCFLDKLTGAYIGVDGTYVGGALQATSEYKYPTPIATAGAGNSPWSQSQVITLRSLRLRGPASHGRIYWPCTGGVVVSSTGVMSASQKTNASNNAKTMINAINAAALTAFGTGWNVGLVSKVGAGVQSPAVRVGIGGRLDSMESRERRLAENHTYQTLTVSTALLEDQDAILRQSVRDYERDLEDAR